MLVTASMLLLELIVMQRPENSSLWPVWIHIFLVAHGICYGMKFEYDMQPTGPLEEGTEREDT